MWLQTREWQLELLDDPGLSAAEVKSALAALERLNIISRGAGILWAEIKKLARAQPQQRLRILDLACGGGDVARALLNKAKRAEVLLTIAACDINARSLEYARRRAEAAGVHPHFFLLDALRDPLPQGYDVVMCSLFLHHLKEHQAVALLERMANATKRLLLVSDLQRNARNYVLVWLGSRLLSRSPVVHQDAVLSMKNAFSRPELADLARRSGLKNFSLHTRCPARMLLRWEKS